MGSVTGRDATSRRSVVRRASSRHDEANKDPSKCRDGNHHQPDHQPRRSIPELDLARARRHPDAENNITPQIAGRPIDLHRPSGPIDDVGPDNGRPLTVDGKPQSTIINMVDHHIGTAGSGDCGNGPVHDRQSISDNKCAAVIRTDDPDNHLTIAVHPERRRAWVGEHPDGHRGRPDKRISFNRHDHRGVGDHHSIPEDKAAGDDDVDLDRCGERCLEIKFDGTKSSGEIDRRCEHPTGGIDPIDRLDER